MNEENEEVIKPKKSKREKHRRRNLIIGILIFIVPVIITMSLIFQLIDVIMQLDEASREVWMEALIVFVFAVGISVCLAGAFCDK